MQKDRYENERFYVDRCLTKKGKIAYRVGFQKDYRVDKKLFDEIYELAEQYNGYYSKYYMSAFLFLTAANRAAFLKAGREKYGLPYENREEQNLSKGKVFNAEEMQVSDDQRYGNNHFYVDHCLHTQKKIKLSRVGFQKGYYVDKNVFSAMEKLAKKHSGYYSKFHMRAFLFFQDKDRDAFLEEGRAAFGFPSVGETEELVLEPEVAQPNQEQSLF